MKILKSNIEISWKGFSVPCIIKLSDKQLNYLEKELSIIATVSYANIEEYRCLTVQWHSKVSTTEQEKEKICEILNTLR